MFYVVFYSFNGTGGLEASLWVQGVAVYGAVVILANTKVLYDTNSHTWFSVMWNFASNGSYFMYLFLVKNIIYTDLFMIFTPLMHYLGSTMIFILWVLMVFPMETAIFQFFEYMRRSRERELYRETKRKEKAMREGIEPPTLGMLRAHTGFAFSGEAGNAPEITNKLSIVFGS